AGFFCQPNPAGATVPARSNLAIVWIVREVAAPCKGKTFLKRHSSLIFTGSVVEAECHGLDPWRVTFAATGGGAGRPECHGRQAVARVFQLQREPSEGV